MDRTATRISITDGEIWCKASYRTREVCLAILRRVGGTARVPHGWDHEAKVWCYPATPAVARIVVDSFGGCDASPDVTALYNAAAPPAHTDDSNMCDSVFAKVRMAPWRHQRIGGRMIETQTATMLMHDMGTGKTKTVIDAVVNLGFKRVLIVCPLAVVEVWPQQFGLHAAENVNVVALTGSTTKRIELLEYHIDQAFGHSLVFVVNYEAVRMKKLEKALSKIEWDLMVTDECHKIKSPSGVQSRACYRIGMHAAKRVGLSGTLMPHSPMDVFGSYRFLDRNIFGISFVAFRNQYAIMGGFTDPVGRPKEVVGYQNQDDMRAKIFSIAHQVKKEDVLDLPPCVHEERRVDLSPDARRIYRELENDFYSQIDAGEITAANVLVKGLRLQQITSGFIGGVFDRERNEERVAEGIDTAKLNALLEILEDLPDKPLVVFARFRHDLEVIRAAAESAGRANFELSGAGNDVADWNESVDSGAPAVLAVQVQSGSEGIDLTRASYAVYYSVGFSLGQFDQSLARLDRPGQTHSVTYVHLIARNTIDEKIYSAFRSRKSVIDAILSRERVL